MKEKRHYLSFGGGINSVALYVLMEQMGMNFEAVFVDHGGDWPETYEYLDYFVATGRPVTILKPNYYRKKGDRIYDNLYEYCWETRMVPSMMARWCTREFKVTPINTYVVKPCYMHLGIDAGEKKRAKPNKNKAIENKWLLIEMGLNRFDCKEMIKKAGLRIPPKSGCWFCPFQRKIQWQKLRKKHPDLFQKAVALEQRNMKARQAKGKSPLSLRSDGNRLEEIIDDFPHLWPEMDYPPIMSGQRPKGESD